MAGEIFQQAEDPVLSDVPSIIWSAEHNQKEVFEHPCVHTAQIQE